MLQKYLIMTYCPIDEAFQDPFVKKLNNKRKNKKRKTHNNINNSNSYQNNNNNNIEGFECLSGSNQLDMSNDYRYKHMLSRNRPENLSVDVHLGDKTQVNRRNDENSYYPDMSLESEYALMTDVKQKQSQGYRPPNPFTHPSMAQSNNNIVDEGDNQMLNNQDNDSNINGGMYESFNELDKNDMMQIEYDTLKQSMNPNEVIMHRNQEPSSTGYNLNNYHPDTNWQNVMPDKPKQKNNTTEIIESNQNSQLETLLKSYKALETKLDMVLSKIDKLEEGGDGKENIHDIILFAIFGVFFIYILDSVYRIGKKTI